MKYSVDIPNGWKMNLAAVKDPVEAYETMTKVAKAPMRPDMSPCGWLIIFIRFLRQHKRSSLVGSPETIRQRIAALEALGIHELIIDFLSATDLASLYRFAQEFI
jgi:hypothetical protein